MSTRRPVNAKTTRRHYQGVLLRKGAGFACLHPWPELGDPTLMKCLRDLRGARRWPIVRRALRCIEEDAKARFIGSSLLADCEIPYSHATLPWQDLGILQQAVDRGFERVKLKVGRHPTEDVQFLQQAATEFPQLRWRLDANEVWSPADAEKFIRALPKELWRKIDFIEDPCPYSTATWPPLYQFSRIPLAVDRESAPAADAAQVMIVKPAIDEPWLLAEAAAKRSQQIVVTSYMEHPLGQCFAAWEAAKLNAQFLGFVGICGLQTHHLYAVDAFSERLGEWSPEFHSPGGTGLGFDDLLERLPWKRLQ